MALRKTSQLTLESIESEKNDYLSSIPEYRILTYPADFTLEGLNLKIINKDIEIPGFQRKYVWKPYQATRLIESFLINLPVPAIFLYKDPKTQNFLVIDGQQRLKTIHYFIEGYLGEEQKGKKRVFRLKEINEKSEWYNRTYSDFTLEEQRKFKNRVLRAFIVEQLDPKDDSSIYHIFERLNTGGTSLTNQEIRNSIAHGKLNDLLKVLNNYESWRQILGKKLPDSRQMDIELILRFICFYYKFADYQKPLKEFMNNFMSQNRNPSQDKLQEIKKIFIQTCDKVHSTLGIKPFNIKAGVNPAVLDSVMYTFARYIDEIPSDINKRYRKLIKNDTYLKSCRNATTDVEVVKKRIEKAHEFLID
jgi:uncharacterized protein with ParB-like and HNH nuclease domain